MCDHSKKVMESLESDIPAVGVGSRLPAVSSGWTDSTYVEESDTKQSGECHGASKTELDID